MESLVSKVEIYPSGDDEDVIGLYFDKDSDGDLMDPMLLQIKDEVYDTSIQVTYSELKAIIAAVEKYRPDLVTQETTD